MPNPGYANFTIKSQAARKLKELSQRNEVSLPALINMMGEKLDPDAKLGALLRALEFAPSLNFSQFLEREGLKLRCASLYYHFKALTSIAVSLLQPSATVDLRVMTDVRALEKKKDQLSAFQAASLIDPPSALQMLQPSYGNWRASRPNGSAATKKEEENKSSGKSDSETCQSAEFSHWLFTYSEALFKVKSQCFEFTSAGNICRTNGLCD